MPLRTIAILVGLSAGCGPVRGSPTDEPDAPPEEIGERSGSRLQRRGHDLDGTQVFFGLYDTARGESCAISTWDDGGTYCTPIENTGSVVFADAGCTTKLGLYYADACTASGPKYFRDYAIDTCGAAMNTLYNAGAASPAKTFFRATDGGCTGPYDASDNEQLFSLGTAVAPAELVAITRSQPTGPDRLQRVFDESADGLRVAPAVLHDRDLATDCFLAAESATTWSCIPQDVQYAGQYADAACTRLITVTPNSCPAAMFAQSYEARGCRYPRYGVYRMGQELATSTGYENGSGTCTAQDYGGDVRLREVGERVDVARATLVTPTAGPRIQRVLAGGETDTFAVPYSLRDTVLAADCVISTATDGVERCLPYGALAQQYYRDAACTDAVTLLRFYRGGPSCEAPEPPAFGRSYVPDPDPCQSSQQIHRVGAEVTTPLYQNNGECHLVMSPLHAFYELGPIVPAADFVAAVPVTGP